MKRRDFIKTAAAAAGAAIGFPTIVPRSVFGQNAPSNRISLGIIGVGNRGGLLALHKVNKDLAVLAGLSDCFQSKRDNVTRLLNQKYGGNVCTPHRDYRELLARKDIDGVIVATHDQWHVPLAIAAARANKHMYVEKPLSPSIRWSQQLRKELAGKNLIFQFGTNQRGDIKAFHQACDLVANGYIGKLKEVHAWCPDMRQDVNNVRHSPFGRFIEEPVPQGFDYDTWIGPADMNPYTADRTDNFGGWHRYETSLGYVGGWGAHPLDIALWGSGHQFEPPVRYEATARMPKEFTKEELLPLMKEHLRDKLDMSNEFYNTICKWDLHAEFADGLKLRFMTSDVARPELDKYHVVKRDHGTTFFGENGWIGVDRSAFYSHDNNALRSLTLKPGEKSLDVHEGRTHMDHFIHAIKTGAPSGTSFEAAFASDVIAHMTNISSRLGRKIEWDSKAGGIVRDDEANAMLDRKPRRGYDFFLG